MHYTSSLVAAALVLAPLASAAGGLYSKDSSVLQVDGKDFNKLVKNSDKASMVEFYAPWCGHCQSLKPAFEKAAKNLEGLANIVAVNCDEEKNKEFCGRMGIKGFPTLKTVRVTGTIGKPIIQDYNGQRTAAGIVEAVKGLISNTVEKLTDDTLDSFLQEKNETTKAILFSDKGTTAALTKVLANEYAINLIFAQARNKEAVTVSTFGISNYPTLVILPGGTADPVFYDGKFEKKALNKFISQHAELYDHKTQSPNARKAKAEKKDKKAASSDSSTFAEASASHASAEASAAAASATDETLEDPLTASPNPIVDDDTPTPVPVPEVVPRINTLTTPEDIQKLCLGPKTQTCILALLPEPTEDKTLVDDATAGLDSLASLAHKHKTRGSQLFPFFAVTAENSGYAVLKSALALQGKEVKLIAVNGKKSWWRLYSGEKGYGNQAVEDWVDGIRFGEGKKEKLPEGLVVEVPVFEEASSEEAAGEEMTEEPVHAKEPIVHEDL